jgi:hypothetical protein
MSRSLPEADAFDSSRECFEDALGWLKGIEASALTHGEIEDQLDCRGRELLRRMYQDHLTLRSVTETRLEAVLDTEAVTHGTVESGHQRPLATIFGDVEVRRLAYRHRAHQNLYLADAVLNLPVERHSHGLRRMAAVEASRGSFEEARDAISRATGQEVAKRQVQALASHGALDVEEFYSTRASVNEATDDDNVLVISADGKGIVMRPDALRPATAKAAAVAVNKLECRLSKGEKRNRKRLAEVGAVYELTPVVRSPADVLASKHVENPAPAPRARAKWVTASVVEDAAVVIAKVFDEAERRDPNHVRKWVALVDGNNHQIDRIEKEATQRGADVTIVVDLSTCSSTSGEQCGASSPKATPVPRPGCMIEHWPCSKATLAR